MESVVSETEEIQSKNKTRRSLFLPSEIPISEPTKCASDEEYLESLKLEEDTWKQIYQEQKAENKNLLKKLKTEEYRNIDYSLFDEDELKYINSFLDLTSFVKEAEDLQNLVKTVSEQRAQQREKYNLMLEYIENSCSNMTYTLNTL